MLLFRNQQLIDWKRLVTLALMVCMVFGVSSCKQKNKDKTEPQQEQILQENSEETILLSSIEEVNFSILDTTHFYIGEIDTTAYVLKIDDASLKGVSGRCYPIDTLNHSAAPLKFQFKRDDTGYRLITRSQRNVPVTFSIAFDSHSIHGTITTTNGVNKEHTISFEQYTEPPYAELTSSRYRKPQYSYSQISDIQYGKAKGFWTSYPMEDDTNYVKMILKLLPKTAVSKKLDLFLDLYVPDDSVQKHPLFVLLHGGAFFFGDKGNRNMREWCENFAKCGYVVASVNYRLGFAISKSSIQQCGYQAIQDAHAALRYLVAHAEEYRIDPDYIFLAGTSAGSITALGTAFMNNENCPPFVAKHKLLKKCGSLHTSGNEYRDKVKIRALANMWGAIYDLHEMDGSRIPVVSFHGTNDKVVPFDQGFPFSGVKSKLGERMFDEMYGSQSIHRYLDSVHVRNKLYPLEGCGHAPYQEKSGALNEHYWFIQEKMQEFFYPELKSKCTLEQDKNSPQWYSLNDSTVTVLHWQAQGGLILDQQPHAVRVLWLEDASTHTLRASGHNAIGVPFKQEWRQIIPC